MKPASNNRESFHAAVGSAYRVLVNRKQELVTLRREIDRDSVEGQIFDARNARRAGRITNEQYQQIKRDGESKLDRLDAAEEAVRYWTNAHREGLELV